MAKELKTHDDRLNWLAEELLLAKEQISSLACRLDALEHGKAPALGGGGIVTEYVHYQSVWEQQGGSSQSLTVGEDDSWAQVGQAVLLPRVAAISFMLVAALILRTVTDNGMVGLMAGSLLGMIYAVVLIAAGVFLHTRKSSLAPVFPVCGVFLLYAIIFETQSHFSSMSGQTGYVILLFAEIIVVLVGIYCQANVLLFVSVFASTIVGIVIGYSNPSFFLLGLIVLANCIAAQVAASRNISKALRWYSLFCAIFFWMFWAYKLNFALKFEPAKVTGLGPEFFLGLIVVFWLFYTWTSLWQILKSGAPLGIFHHILPTVVAGGSFFAINAVLSPWVGKQELIGTVAVVLSALYLGLVAWLAGRDEEGIPGGKAFVAAATILLIQGLAIAVPPLWALPMWAGAAAILTLGAERWRSGGVRVISYLFQGFILIFALRHETFAVESVSWPVGFVVFGLMAGITLWLHRWCRRHPPNYDSAFFEVFDRKDYSAVLLLCLGLFQGFAALRFVLFAALQESLAGSAIAFACVQSVLANVGIVLLLILGLKGRNRELITVAGGVVLVVAVKVFLIDLFRASGLPLVMSVFSFGIVAATSSVVLRKWQGGEGGGDAFIHEGK